MQNEKTNESGAKITRYDCRADFARILSERELKAAPINPELSKAGYIVAIDEKLPPEPFTVYLKEDGGETYDANAARLFDTYGDALKWTVENVDIQNVESPAPHGFEKPRFPRVQYLRVYTEITDL